MNAANRAPASDLFRKVDTQRASEVVADRLRTLIRGGQLSVGERLPPERELCESLGVSRVTLREALRMLEANGLIRTEVGRSGGAIVTAPTAGRIGEGISDMISMSALSAADVTEARLVIELGIVPLVCERATEQDIADLLALCDSASEARRRGDYDVASSYDFHLRVAEATHNPAISLLLQSFREPMLDSLSEAHHSGTSGVDEHREFVLAVGRRDVSEATSILRRHLDRTAARVAER